MRMEIRRTALFHSSLAWGLNFKDTTESSSPLVNPLLNWKGTRALKLSRRYLIRNESRTTSSD